MSFFPLVSCSRGGLLLGGSASGSLGLSVAVLASFLACTAGLSPSMFCILSPSTACRLALLSCSGEAEASGFFATLAFLLLVGADPLPYFPRFLQHGLDLVRVALDPWHVAVDDLHQSIRHVPHLVTVTKSLLVEHEVRFIVLTEHFPRLVVSSPFTGVHLSRYPSIEGLCGCRVSVAPPELQTGSFGPGRPQEDFLLLLASEAPAEMVALVRCICQVAHEACTRGPPVRGLELRFPPYRKARGEDLAVTRSRELL